MKTLAAISACAFLAAALPAFAGSTEKSELKANGAGTSHSAQPGARGTESGKTPKMSEGRASASDRAGKMQNSGANGGDKPPTPKMGGAAK